MGLIRLLVGFLVTLEHEGIARIVKAIKAADNAFNSAIAEGALMRPDKERKALAEDAMTMLSKYVTEQKTDGKTIVPGGQPTPKFEAELQPFHLRSEILAAINCALSENTSAWTDFENAWSRVVSYATRRKERNLFSTSDDALPRPWEGTPEEGALNWAWGPLMEAIEQGQDPDEVKSVTQLRVGSVCNGLHDLELVRTAAAVQGVRKVIIEVKKLRAELQSKKASVEMFQDVERLQADLKRAGQGRLPNESLGSTARSLLTHVDITQ